MARRIDPDRPVARKWKTSPPRCKTCFFCVGRLNVLNSLDIFLGVLGFWIQMVVVFFIYSFLRATGELDEVLAVEKTHV